MLKRSTLKNRRIVIVGASRGLGAALFQWLISQNVNVLGIGRSKPNFIFKPNCFLELDLSIEKNVELLVTNIKEFKADSIVHCMGGGFKRSSDLISKKDFLYLLNLNFLVALEINNAILPQMIENKKGWIIHLGSVATKEITASIGYTCVKSLITPYVRNLGRKLINKGVYVSGVTLGAVIGNEGSMDRLRDDKPMIFDEFISSRRPTKRATPVNDLLPYFQMLLSANAKLHASNMITLDEGESITL